MTIPQAFQMALQRHQAGRLAEAEALYRQILAAQPNHADALHLLGVIAHQAGRHDIAVEMIGQSIVFNPRNPFAHSNLGEGWRAMGRMDEAIASFRRVLEVRPDLPQAHNNLGTALAAQGRIDEAIAEFRREIEINPNYPEAHGNMGASLAVRGKLVEAITAFRRALEFKPDYVEAHNNLGNALRDLGQIDEAVASYRRALELKPDFMEAHNNLGNALRDQGQLDEAMAAYRRALDLKPEDAGMHSNLIYALHFHPSHDERTIAEEQRRWNLRFGEPVKPSILPHSNDRDPDRKLRIGYVSPAFWDHVTGRYLLPLIKRHDRQKFEILCYAGGVRSDTLTEEFHRHADQWRSTGGMGDEALAEMIRRDGVDILVDLTQHMAGNRLPMFARRPAPVQVSFAGYPESTGLDAIEYRISGRHLEVSSASSEGKGAGNAVAGLCEAGPPSSADAHTGKTQRVSMIDTFWCYDPCGVEREIQPLPALESGKATFGNLGNFSKLNEETVKLWSRVLAKLPDSRLILLSSLGSHRQRTLEVLESEGIEALRVEFVEFQPRRQYLETYHRLDIVLDTAPYNGHTTSLDALWMGVPVVSLAGKTAVSRAGLSLLTNLGLPELVARSEAEFVGIAEGLARDLPRLAHLRSTLRERMENSVLMDASHFARQVECAYREMWRAWCAGK